MGLENMRKEQFAEKYIDLVNKGETGIALSMYGGYTVEPEFGCDLLIENYFSINSLHPSFLDCNDTDDENIKTLKLYGVCFTVIADDLLFLALCILQNRYGMNSLHGLLNIVNENDCLQINDLCRYSTGVLIGFPYGYGELFPEIPVDFEYLTPLSANCDKVDVHNRNVPICAVVLPEPFDIEEDFEDFKAIEIQGCIQSFAENSYELFSGFEYLSPEDRVKVVVDNVVRLHKKTIGKLSDIIPVERFAAYDFTSDVKAAFIKKYGNNPHKTVAKKYNRCMKNLRINNLFASYSLIIEFMKRCKSSDIDIIIESRFNVNRYHFIFYLLGLNELNPLPPHRLCRVCKRYELELSVKNGFDLDPKQCPICGSMMYGDGHNLKPNNFNSLVRKKFSCWFHIHVTRLSRASKIKKGLLIEWFRLSNGNHYSDALPLECMDILPCTCGLVDERHLNRLERLTGVKRVEVPYNYKGNMIFISHANNKGLFDTTQDSDVVWNLDNTTPDYHKKQPFADFVYCEVGAYSRSEKCRMLRKVVQHSWYYYHFKTEYYTAFLLAHYTDHDCSDIIEHAKDNGICFVPTQQYLEEPFQCCGNVIIYSTEVFHEL